MYSTAQSLAPYQASKTGLEARWTWMEGKQNNHVNSTQERKALVSLITVVYDTNHWISEVWTDYSVPLGKKNVRNRFEVCLHLEINSPWSCFFFYRLRKHMVVSHSLPTALTAGSQCWKSWWYCERSIKCSSKTSSLFEVAGRNTAG